MPPRQVKAKSKPDSTAKADAGGEDALEVQDGPAPWKNIFRPTCAAAPKDNSFTLDDEALVAAAESVLSSLTVSDPNEQGNPLCYVSPGFLSMTGYGEHECLGRNCKFLQAGKADPAALEQLRSGASSRSFASAELTNYRKDGRAFQNLLGVAPVLSGDGAALMHLVGCQCDLDERRRRGEQVDEAWVARWAEQARQSLTAFALVDVSGGGGGGGAGGAGGAGAAAGAQGAAGSGAGPVGSPPVSRATTAGSPGGTPPAAAVCAVSPGFTALTGYAQADVLGWNLLCLCGPDSSERDMKRLITAQWAHTPVAVKLLCYRRDGTPFWALVLSCPLASVAAAAQEGAAGAVAAARLGSGGLAAAAAAAAAARGPGAAGRSGTLGLGSLGGAAPGSLLGGLLQGGSGAAAGGGGGAPPAPPVKYCLCCVVDVTAQRLRRIVGGKYVLGKVIGAGAFGLVRVGKNVATEELVAVKSVDASRFRSIAEIDQIQEEMNVLASLKHPHIIRLMDVHFQSNTFFLVMEFAGGGSLVSFMRAHGDPAKHCLDEATAGRVFVQMISALDYCHRRRVIHRDLKPENILMDASNNLKIADFGLAAVAAPTGGLTLQCGTPEFTAPEITTGREYEGASVDIWSMGVILYEALSGGLPFRGASTSALFKAIQKGVYDPLPKHISAECRDLVKRMLIVDPRERISMDEILRHAWIQRNAAAAAAAGGGARLVPAASVTLDGSSSVLLPGAGSVNLPSDGLSLGGGLACSLSGGVDGGHSGPDGMGDGAGPRGVPPRISETSGQGALSGMPLPGAGVNSRPSSAGLGLGGPGSGAGGTGGGKAGAGSLGLGGAAGGGSLHDSVKLVIPSGAMADDPILAAILRGHASGDSASPARSGPGPGAGGDEEDFRVQTSAHSASPASGAAGGGGGGRGRDSTPVGPSRMGPSSRSMGGMPTGAAGGGLHGGGAQGNGKARAGQALLPTLGGGGGSAGGPGSPGLHTMLDRRLQEPSRFRSPARAGHPASPGQAARTQGSGLGSGRTAAAAGGGGAGAAAGGAQAADGNGRQLPPISNTTRGGPVKKDSRGPGSARPWLGEH